MFLDFKGAFLKLIIYFKIKLTVNFLW